MFLEKTKWWELLFAKLEPSTTLSVTHACMRGRVCVALTAPFVVTAQIYSGSATGLRVCASMESLRKGGPGPRQRQDLGLFYSG